MFKKFIDSLGKRNKNTVSKLENNTALYFFTERLHHPHFDITEDETMGENNTAIEDCTTQRFGKFRLCEEAEECFHSLIFIFFLCVQKTDISLCLK